jgi:hypothetical protein
MRNVKIQKAITSCNLTPEDYELFDYRESIDAANNINKAILEHFNNSALSNTQKLDNVMEVMKQYAKCGAYDSEPIRVVERVLQELTAGTPNPYYI